MTGRGGIFFHPGRLATLGVAGNGAIFGAMTLYGTEKVLISLILGI